MDDVKLPWYVDLLNINLDNHDLTEAKSRIRLLAGAFRKDGTRITQNLDSRRRQSTIGRRVYSAQPRSSRWKLLRRWSLPVKQKHVQTIGTLPLPLSMPMA